MDYRIFILPNLIAMLSFIIGSTCSALFLIPLLIQVARRKEKKALKPFVISAVIATIGFISFIIFITTGTYVLVV